MKLLMKQRSQFAREHVFVLVNRGEICKSAVRLASSILLQQINDKNSRRYEMFAACPGVPTHTSPIEQDHPAAFRK